MDLTTLRGNIIDALTESMPEGTKVVGWETKAVPPAAIVIPGVIDREGPVTHGLPWAVHYVVQIIAGKGTGQAVQARLDSLITAAVLALQAVDDDTARVQVDNVRGPLTGERDDLIGAEIELTAAISMKAS